MNSTPTTNPPSVDGHIIVEPDDDMPEIDSDVTSPPSLEDEKSGEPLSSSWREEPLTSDEASKVTQILRACRDQDRNQLIALAATEGGFVEDHVRRLAWPILLGRSEKHDNSEKWEDLPAHHDEAQVKLDVHRAFVHYPTGESNKQIEGRKEELSSLITQILRQHPCLCYFQGYHDIAQVLLLVLGAEEAASLLARLSLLRIRDFMLPTIAATNSHLQLLPAILYAADPVLCRHLSGTQPFFALAATLTLYAHDIEEYGGIARLFDFLLAREAVMSVYVYATIIMTRKSELLELGADEPEMLYAILCKLPKPLDLEDLVSRAISLFEDHRPETLPFGAWRKVSSYSTLKTTRDSTAVARQTLQEGEKLLKKHSEEIERQVARKKMLIRTRQLAHRYRHPARAVSLAVFIGVLSLCLGRSGQTGGLHSILGTARQRFVDVIGYTLGFVQK
ncbi:hypothetical protein AAFC00_002208 [Neodothiora populina]|uniref:Rab-GAP TBC domain-containing protein n=1 Tax=Neodothiora populina TaxID=2781224 RepID=A0ABR3PHU4_9PEZI